MAVLTATGLQKRYKMGRHVLEILRGADLVVDEGETVAIVGQSGAGKSTLLHVLGGLDQPDGGSVSIFGEDFYAASMRRRTALRGQMLGFVFQSYHLLHEMDVLENVCLPALNGLGAHRRLADMREQAMELLRSVGMEDRAHHRPLELSGGEQQRVALARALMNRPRIILADEPTGNLDAENGRRVLEYLFALTADGRHTLVVVTHDQSVAASCNRTLVIHEGVLCAAGEMEE